jgi:hypothetical protein
MEEFLTLWPTVGSGSGSGLLVARSQSWLYFATHQTGYTVHAGFCMFPRSCDLRTETAGSL